MEKLRTMRALCAALAVARVTARCAMALSMEFVKSLYPPQVGRVCPGGSHDRGSSRFAIAGLLSNLAPAAK